MQRAECVSEEMCAKLLGSIGKEGNVSLDKSVTLISSVKRCEREEIQGSSQRMQTEEASTSEELRGYSQLPEI